MKYFLYSDEQIKEKNKVLGRTGKKFVPGTISINGKYIAPDFSKSDIYSDI